MILIDLDNFKNINDTMGHEVGDQILIETAKRLEEISNDEPFISRYGGDEFAILIHSADEKVIDTFCSQINAQLKAPFIIDDLAFVLSSSIGVSLYPQDAQTAESLIQHADTAMYEAKKNGKNQIVYYDASMQHSLQQFLHLESMIRDGLEHKLFELHFQPLIQASTDTLQGFEALLRLSHPQYGSIPPSALIPVAEKNGTILAIGREILAQACTFIQEIRPIYHKPFYVAINISAKQLYQNNFARELLAYLEQHSIPASFLKVELTETTIMENIEITSQQLHILQQGGVCISLDDFGTGYSSFAYLAQLPIQTLKIDQSFVQSFHHSQSNRHIIKAITQLAHVMEMEVTAEGVETQEEYNFLMDNKIDTFQGYFFSKPITRSTIMKRLSGSDSFLTVHALKECAL
jgi:diguanylate cyclase (GGDEF)-like protein